MKPANMVVKSAEAIALQRTLPTRFGQATQLGIGPPVVLEVVAPGVVVTPRKIRPFS